MKLNPKMILILLTIVLIIIVGGYLLKINSKNGQTYMSPNLGYSIDLPKEVKIETEKETETFFINATLSGKDGKLLLQGLAISVSQMPSEDKSPLELLDKRVNVDKFKDKISVQQVDGLPSQSVKFQFPDWNQFTYVVKGNKAYEFQIYVKGNDQLANLDLANKILETVKFK